MTCFYQHLLQGKERPAEAYQLAMKDLRETEEFKSTKFWAPRPIYLDDTLNIMISFRLITITRTSCPCYNTKRRGEEQNREEGEMAQKKLGGGEIWGKSREEGEKIR